VPRDPLQADGPARQESRPTRDGQAFRFDLRELSGALGDLGTLLPLLLGTIAVAGLAPMPVA
jgi:hypothetical protein